jgi:hypothetical protein
MPFTSDPLGNGNVTYGVSVGVVKVSGGTGVFVNPNGGGSVRIVGSGRYGIFEARGNVDLATGDFNIANNDKNWNTTISSFKVFTMSCKEFSSDLIDKVIARLDDTGHDQGSNWAWFKNLEMNGFDMGGFQSSFHYHLVDSTVTYFADDDDGIGDKKAPLADYPDFTVERERALVLCLRDRMRAELNMPPLTEEEKTSWRYYERPVPKVVPRDGAADYQNEPGLTVEQINQVIAHFRKHRPEDVRYMKSVFVYNTKLLTPGDPRWINQWYEEAMIEDYIANHFDPEYGSALGNDIWYIRRVLSGDDYSPHRLFPKND